MTYSDLFEMAPHDPAWQAGILRGAAMVREQAGHTMAMRDLVLAADAIDEARAAQAIEDGSIYA